MVEELDARRRTDKETAGLIFISLDFLGFAQRWRVRMRKSSKLTQNARMKSVNCMIFTSVWRSPPFSERLSTGDYRRSPVQRCRNGRELMFHRRGPARQSRNDDGTEVTAEAQRAQR